MSLRHRAWRLAAGRTLCRRKDMSSAGTVNHVYFAAMNLFARHNSGGHFAKSVLQNQSPADFR